MKRLILILTLALLPASAFSQTFKTTVTAPAEVSMTVFAGFADSSQVIEPVSKAVSGSTAKYVYELESGDYHFVSSGYGFYTLKKNFLVNGKACTIDADPGRISEKGYQNLKISYSYTDEVNQAQLSVTALSKKFPKVLTTPGYNPKKPVGEHTTQAEMEEYLAKLDKSVKNMYTYTAGYSTKGLRLPVAVFTTTDLEGMSLEEAGAAVLANGKPTIYLHAEIHGNENSPGEGALGMCAELSGSYGAKVLPKINVVVLPRVNCDGTKDWTRGTSIAPDMNRDNLLCKNPEVKAAHRIYNAFQPAIVLDMHEYGVVSNYRKTQGYLDDAGITVGGNQNNSRKLNELQKLMMRYVEKRGLEEGLRYWEYTQAGYSDQSPLHASHYYALRSSANFLVETPSGFSQRKSSFKRRVFTQFFAAEALIEFAMEHSDELMAACKADREHVISAKDPFILRHGQNEEAYTYNRSIFSYEDGHKIKDTAFSVRYYEVPLITRERAAAYVIPKGVRFIDRILEIARYNGIAYEELPAGTKMKLSQYAQNPKWKPVVQKQVPGRKPLFEAENVEKYAVLMPKDEIFENGAYIFKTAQPSAIVLMMLMEPDVIMTDQYPITLVQAGLLKVEDLYRL